LGAIFFVETASVIVQTLYFKYTKRRTGEGRRVFKMAPLHHHYEALGVHESKIVIRFWIVTALLVILTLSLLRLRGDRTSSKARGPPSSAARGAGWRRRGCWRTTAPACS